MLFKLFIIYHYHNTKHIYVPLGVENINSAHFADTGLPGYFVGWRVPSSKPANQRNNSTVETSNFAVATLLMQHFLHLALLYTYLMYDSTIIIKSGTKHKINLKYFHISSVLVRDVSVFWYHQLLDFWWHSTSHEYQVLFHLQAVFFTGVWSGLVNLATVDGVTDMYHSWILTSSFPINPYPANV